MQTTPLNDATCAYISSWSVATVLRWRIPAVGLLARLAAPVIANLKSLPPGVRIDADFVVIDLRDILASQGHADLIAFVRALRIETRADGFLVTFELASP
jgi:hypothetical protein